MPYLRQEGQATRQVEKSLERWGSEVVNVDKIDVQGQERKDAEAGRGKDCQSEREKSERWG
jgi:hypothetical protein